MSNFKPKKLSRESLDAYVAKHGSLTPINTQNTCTTFKTGNGTIYYLDPRHLLLSQETDEFKYLLGQTLPAHTTDYIPSLKEIAYIQTDNGSSELWTRDTKLMADFASLAKGFNYISLRKRS